MIYILTNKLIDGYWFGKYPTLEVARIAASNYPEAVHIVEYKDANSEPKGIVPTGRSFPLEETL